MDSREFFKCDKVRDNVFITYIKKIDESNEYMLGIISTDVNFEKTFHDYEHAFQFYLDFKKNLESNGIKHLIKTEEKKYENV